MNFQGLVEELRKFGLTSNEAKSYVALAKLGASEPRSVAAEAVIPYPNAYEALKRLAQRGWVELVRHRPALYRAREPKTVMKEVEARLEQTFKSLEAIYRRTPAREAELVYTLRGKERVLSKVVELLDGARSSVFLVAPSTSLREQKVLEALRKLRRRNVSLKAVSDEEGLKLLPNSVDARRGKLLIAVDLLVDGDKALIGLPDYSACGWLDSPQVAAHFRQFLELFWGSATPSEPLPMR